jgi:DNA-binding IclR family transcriptional regulator
VAAVSVVGPSRRLRRGGTGTIGAHVQDAAHRIGIALSA